GNFDDRSRLRGSQREIDGQVLTDEHLEGLRRCSETRRFYREHVPAGWNGRELIDAGLVGDGRRIDGTGLRLDIDDSADDDRLRLIVNGSPYAGLLRKCRDA